MNATRESTDVLIVGGGPTGLVSALLLAKLGVRSIVVERNPKTDEHPKAHELNARSAEILQTIGITEDDLAAEASPLEDGSRILFCHTIREEIGRIDLMADEARAEKYRRHLRSPLPYFNLSQSEFEKILVERVRQCAQTALRFRHRWEAMEETPDAVISTIQCEESKQTYTIQSKYLLAADGASSRVRKSAGIAMDGPLEIQTFVNAYFQTSLRHLVPAPAKLYWILHPQFAGAFIAHHIDKRWVYGVPVYRPYEEPEDFSPEELKRRIQGALGCDIPGLEITSISTWRMTAQVAQRYREGRMFLVGDAAHRFPPTGGLGMNTGIADAHNLCWKISDVLHGRAGESLLDSYEQERRPVAQMNCEESLRNYDKIFEVLEAMGLNRKAPETFARVMNSFPIRALPGGLKKAIRRMAAAPADLMIRRVFTNSRVRERVRASIADQMGHFDRLGLDIGYHYQAGALIEDDSKRPTLRNEVSDYEPSARPGARLPHVWLSVDGSRKSLHDLTSYERFALITRDASVWEEAVTRVTQSTGVRLDHVSIGSGSRVEDDSGEWTRIAGIDESGALLVRPDGHVAWRCRDAPPDPVAALIAAFNSIRSVVPRETVSPADELVSKAPHSRLDAETAGT